MYGQNKFSKGGQVGRYTMPAYKAWKEEAGYLFNTQNISYFYSRVDIHILLNGGNGNSDCDNLIKGCLDFIVKMKVIKNDNKKYVRSVKVEWCDKVQKGATVIIMECE
jgi:Holliday junction resolvase RusA-like endonuclease